MRKSKYQRGIELLDEAAGSAWPCRIKLTELDIAYSDTCILGQLYADQTDPSSSNVRLRHGFWVGVDLLRLDPLDAVQCGFDSQNGQFSSLNRTWKRLIKKLQNERNCNEK